MIGNAQSMEFMPEWANLERESTRAVATQAWFRILPQLASAAAAKRGIRLPGHRLRGRSGGRFPRRRAGRADSREAWPSGAVPRAQHPEMRAHPAAEPQRPGALDPSGEAAPVRGRGIDSSAEVRRVLVDRPLGQVAGTVLDVGREGGSGAGPEPRGWGQARRVGNAGEGREASRRSDPAIRDQSRRRSGRDPRRRERRDGGSCGSRLPGDAVGGNASRRDRRGRHAPLRRRRPSGRSACTDSTALTMSGDDSRSITPCIADRRNVHVSCNRETSPIRPR